MELHRNRLQGLSLKELKMKVVNILMKLMVQGMVLVNKKSNQSY